MYYCNKMGPNGRNMILLDNDYHAKLKAQTTQPPSTLQGIHGVGVSV